MPYFFLVNGKDCAYVYCTVVSVPDFSVFARSLPHFLSGFMSAISLAILLKVLETGSAYSCITYSSKRSTLTTFVLPLEKYLVFVRQYYRGYELGYALSCWQIRINLQNICFVWICFVKSNQ